MALPTHIDLQIVTPDRVIVRDKVDEVEVPGSEGYFGVLPGHAPFLSSLSVGELWYRKGSEKTYVAIASGFAEVLPESVTILAQLAERPEDIDVARAEAARKRAEERLKATLSGADADVPRAGLALVKALNRLQVSSRGAGSDQKAGAHKKVRT